MLLLISFIFGTIIGSFANVFVLRYGTGRSVGGRSSCGSCGRTLAWYELIPVISWLIQKGRCRSCQGRVSAQYILVELVFGIVFVSAAHSLQLTTFTSLHPYLPAQAGILLELLYLWTISFLLISIAVYDIRHMIIPDGMLIALGGVVLIQKIWQISQHLFTQLHPYILTSFISSLHPFLAGPLVALPFFFLWLVSSGRWMGFGDIKLSLVLGWMLGVLGGFSALIFGVWAGAITSLAIMGTLRLHRGFGGQDRLVSRKGGLTMKSEIPFGPFLVVGALFVLLTGVTLQTILLYP